MTELRIVGDVIEMGGRAVATLIPGLRLSDRDRLEEIFDALDEDGETIALLGDRVAELEARLKKIPSERSTSVNTLR